MAYVPLKERIKLAEEFKSKWSKISSRVERFNKIINRMEIGIDECLPDLPAFLVDATEILNEAYYTENLPRNEFNKGKRRIDNITSRFFKECLCENIKR